jgi:hypothetical protein
MQNEKDGEQSSRDGDGDGTNERCAELDSSNADSTRNRHKFQLAPLSLATERVERANTPADSTDRDEIRTDDIEKGKGVYSIACALQCECGAVNLSDNPKVVFAAVHQMIIEIKCSKCQKQIMCSPRQMKEQPRIVVPGTKMQQKGFGKLHV